jgi:hypothetical protein
MVEPTSPLSNSDLRNETLGPGVTLRAFALVRTMGLQPDVDRIVAPCVGVVLRRGHDADRQDDVPEPPLTLF